MNLPASRTQVLDFSATSLVIELSPGQLSSNAGLFLIRQFDDRMGFPQAFAAALYEAGDGILTELTFREVARAHGYGIQAGYEDQDHDDILRSDIVFKFVADRFPDDTAEPRPGRQLVEAVDVIFAPKPGRKDMAKR